MKALAVFAVLLAAAQARSAPQPLQQRVDHARAQPASRHMPVLDGAAALPAARIVNGVQAARGQFPYQAALYLDAQSFCGGSLISTRWVLTAAHCASGASFFFVYLGAQNLNTGVEDGRLVVTSTIKVVHEGYSAPTLANDVALIDLSLHVSLSNYIQVIGLASGPDLYEGNTARISGWGKISEAATSVSPLLQYVDEIVLSNSVCALLYGNIVTASTLCATGSNGRATCTGDGGGPLVDLASGKQIGVASFDALSGCQSGYPNGFARVSAFAAWITANSGVAV